MSIILPNQNVVGTPGVSSDNLFVCFMIEIIHSFTPGVKLCIITILYILFTKNNTFPVLIIIC